jgi:hypothetical protein
MNSQLKHYCNPFTYNIADLRCSIVSYSYSVFICAFLDRPEFEPFLINLSPIAMIIKRFEILLQDYDHIKRCICESVLLDKEGDGNSSDEIINIYMIKVFLNQLKNNFC